MVAFASAVPHFEWGATLEQLDVDHVLLRDSDRRWYVDGYDIAKVFRMAMFSYRRVIALGLSMGAYGALLYGRLWHAHEIIAISPVTCQDVDAHDIPTEHHHRIRYVEGDVRFPDLQPLYVGQSSEHVRAFVSDGHDTQLDYIMAARLGLKNITMIPGHSHDGLARHMRDTGLIEELIRDGL